MPRVTLHNCIGAKEAYRELSIYMETERQRQMERGEWTPEWVFKVTVCQNWTKRAVSEVVMQCNEKNQRANASCTQAIVLSIFSLLPTGAKIHHTSTLLQTLHTARTLSLIYVLQCITYYLLYFVHIRQYNYCSIWKSCQTNYSWASHIRSAQFSAFFKHFMSALTHDFLFCSHHARTYYIYTINKVVNRLHC